MDRFRAPQASEEPEYICYCDACGLEIYADDEVIVVNVDEYIIHDESYCEEMLDISPDTDDYNRMRGSDLLEGGYV